MLSIIINNKEFGNNKNGDVHLKTFKKIFYHIVLLFILGGLFGYFFETISYLIKNGKFINKQGMWFSPLKPIYGLGIILISALLYKLKKKNPIWIFLLGLLIGATFEYIASLFQDYILHTSTWNYSNMKNDLNGRINLPYSIIWGAITYLWIKYGLDIYLKFYNKILKFKLSQIIIIIITIFLALDLSLTSIVTKRYSQRKRCIEATSDFDTYIDKYFNNKVFEKKFPNLRVKT